MIKWPEKIIHKEHCYGRAINDIYLHCTCGATHYNEAIDACQKACEEAHGKGLVALDEEKKIRLKYQELVYVICSLFDETIFIENKPCVTRCTIDTVYEKVRELKRRSVGTPPRDIPTVQELEILKEKAWKYDQLSK